MFPDMALEAMYLNLAMCGSRAGYGKTVSARHQGIRQARLQPNASSHSTQADRDADRHSDGNPVWRWQ
jgi:hypothetical protein